MTPRKSARASARRHYLAMGGRDLVFALAPQPGQGAVRKVDMAEPDNRLAQEPPLPNPLPKGEREHSEFADWPVQEDRKAKTPNVVPQTPSLMARVQALYEDTAVPVREIARLAGVTERTLYKYIRRGAWKRRYVRAPSGDAASGAVPGAVRGERWLRAAGHEPVKGAGGRFVARAEAGRPVAQDIAHGLKALDPAARAKASAACAAASLRHAAARKKADAAQVWEARRRAIDSVSAAMAAYSRWREGRARRAALYFYEGGPGDAARADDARTEALYVEQIEAALACLRKLKR